MYRAASSYTMRTSVRWDTGRPSEGSRWVKPARGSRPDQTSSLSRPSMTGGAVISDACTLGDCWAWRRAGIPSMLMTAMYRIVRMQPHFSWSDGPTHAQFDTPHASKVVSRGGR